MKSSRALVSSRTHGFSIAEVLVGAVLLAVAMAGAAALLVSGTTTRTSTARNDQRQALIDNDIALIQERARLYTWCTGAARFTNDTCPGGIAPGSEDYYSVDYNDATELCWNPGGTPTPSFNANCNAFRNACVNGQIAAPLSTEITTNIPQTQLDTANLVRAVAVDDAQEHRLAITYTSTGADAQVIRRFVLVPPVAAWCPSRTADGQWNRCQGRVRFARGGDFRCWKCSWWQESWRSWRPPAPPPCAPAGRTSGSLPWPMNSPPGSSR
jgi:Tfp pilus assembly protein PilV